MAWMRRKAEIWKKEEQFLWHKASMTVESAFVLPFFFFAVTMIAGMLDLYHTTILVQTALCEGAKELGMYSYCVEGDTESPVGAVNQAVCMAYGTGKVREVLKKESLPQILGGVQGISLLPSSYENDTIVLKASFVYCMPADIFRSFPLTIKTAGQARAWVGYKGEKYGVGEQEEMVYVTEWESVYHESESCSYLHLSVNQVSYDSLDKRMNQYGEHYHKCGKCWGENTVQRNVYISESGNHYHSFSGCSGLTRHVKLIKKSELKNLKVCTRCGGKDS